MVDWSGLLTDGLTLNRPVGSPVTLVSSPQLSTEAFTQSTRYDALGRMTRLENWHIEGRTPAIYTPVYNRRGVLESETLAVNTEPASPAIRRIEYNAKGQRTRIQYGNGTATRYHYDPPISPAGFT